MAPYEDARSQANAALGEKAIGSVKTAFTFLGGTGAALTAVGGGLAALDRFDVIVLGVLVGVTILSFPSALFVMELVRLRRHSHALDRVLQAERNFDALLEQVRQERNELERRLLAAEVRLEAQSAVREILELVAGRRPRGSRRGQPAEQEERS